MADEKITKRQKQAAVQTAWRCLTSLSMHNDFGVKEDLFLSEAADALVAAFPEYLGK